MNLQKCAVIGCGAVGSTTAFTLLKSGLFSEMVLIDINHKRAEGEAMDIAHSVPFVRPVNVFAGGYADLADCGIIIITAGANQSPGETRIDLVRRNVKVFQSIVPQIVTHNREAILLVVANPVDILTYVALKLSGFPARRVIGSGTVLDTARLKYLLGEQLEVDPRNIHSFIIGEHGDTELPVWSSANISGIDLADYCKSCARGDEVPDIDAIFHDVKNSAYRIIENKGATNYAISMAVLRIAEAIVRDENSVLPVSGLVDGHYGLHDLCLGLPAIVGREGIRRILDFPLSERENTALKASADALGRVLNDIGEIGAN